MEDLQLHEAVVFLAAAGVVIPIVKRLHISPVLGFLMIGLAVGPYGLARLADDYTWLSYILITDVAGVRALAELGVIFLLFMIGLELSLERLWAMRRLVLGMGSTQIVVSAIIIGLIAWGFGNPVEVAVLLGACLALSSTAIVMQLLVEQGRFGTGVGQGTFGVLLAQDIAVVPILFLVGAFGVQQGGPLILELGFALLEAALAVGLILGIGRYLIRPLFRFVADADSPELFMAVTLLVIIATASITHAAGLSAALGAFLAGILLAESEYRHEIEVNIEPFKGLLLGLFFMSVAMGIDLFEIMSNPGWIFLSVAGLIIIKALIMTVIARAFGFNPGQSLEMGLLLGQGGEFAFLVLGLALGYQLLPDATAQFMLIVVGATMFLTPLTAKLGQHLRTLISAREQTEADVEIATDLKGHVIIVGYGRTGKLLAALLDRQQIAHIGLDLDARRVADLSAEGVPIFRGDASRAAILAKANLKQAAVLAICTDDHAATELVLAAAQREAPDVPVIARAHDTRHAEVLMSHGASRVVPEVLECGLHLGQVMFEHVGLPSTVARDLVDAQRTELSLALDASARHQPAQAEAEKVT